VKSCISCNTACSRSCLRVRVHSVERRSNPALFLAWCQLSGLRHRLPCRAVAAKRKCASYGRRSALSRSYFSSPTAIKRRSGDRLRKALPSLAGSHAQQTHTQPAKPRPCFPTGGWGALPGLSSRTCCHARAPRGCGDAADAPCGHMTAVSLLLAPLVSMWRWGPATAAR
jgi:hypothetical protein